MNNATLHHHNELIDWYAQKRLCRDPAGQEVRQKKQGSSMTPDKFQHIGDWCTEVNKLFIQPPKKESPHLFRKCKYSDAMFPPNKSTLKTRSACGQAVLWTTPGKREAVRGAILTGKAGAKPQLPSAKAKAKARLADHQQFVDDTDPALTMKMADNNNHYAQERRIVHINIQPEWKRKLSTGWTINRPTLYPKTPPPCPPSNILVDIPNYLVRNEDGVMEVWPQDGIPKRKPGADGSENLDTPAVSSAESRADRGRDQGHSEQNDETNDSFEDRSGVRTKGTQCEAVVAEASDRKPISEEEESPRSRYRPIISDRSTSNEILKVLSVDDCKLMMRHRPQRVVETQDTMILPVTKSTKILNGHGDNSLREAEGKEEVSFPEEESTAIDAASDVAVTTTDNNPIRLSQGSAKTTLSPSQVQSRAKVYRVMYDRYSKMTPEAKVQRPSSAAVEKAFDVILDKKFQAVQSSRRPLSSPAKFLQSRPSSRMSSHSGLSSTPSHRFQQLNNTLRQQMYNYLDSRWFHTKMKFQKTKNGYTRSAMKKGRMITSSPKPGSLSDGESDSIHADQ